MPTNLLAFLLSAGAVTLAEMGDKTQLLAMAFAAKYKAPKVLWGVLIATVLNHALAVAAGNYLTRFASAKVWVQGLAALSFIIFGLWTLKGDKLEGEEKRRSRFGAVATVAVAFFFAELGDKTQLATIALAARFPAAPMGILTGTTTGMLVADAIGIYFGVVMGRRMPEKTVKLVSAAAFVLFGFIGSYQVSREMLGLSMPVTLCLMSFLLLITGISAGTIIKQR